MLPLPTDMVGSPFSLCHLPPTREIAAVLYDVFSSDAENMRFWLRGKNISSVDEVFDGIKRAYESENMYMYYILIQDKIVGEIGFASIDMDNKSVYVDYWLAPNVRGQRMIDRFLFCIEDMAFNMLKMKHILLRIDAENIASRKVAERNSYVLNKIVKSDKVWSDGSFHDECEYSKLKSDWVKERKNA